MYLFIVRRFNDIDHMVPIVWRMAREGDGPLAILCTDANLDLSADFRLEFLRREYGVRTLHIGEAAPTTLSHRAANLAVDGLRRSGRTTGPVWQAAVDWQAAHCTHAWALKLFDAWKPRVVIFDWCKPEKSLAGKIVEAARERSIPRFAVPHGVNYMTNGLRTLKAVETGIPSNWGNNLRAMNYVIVQHRRHGEWMVQSGVEPEKILVFGSTRFCREWCRVHQGLVPKAAPFAGPSSGKLKVVYFDHIAEMRLNISAIERSLTAMAARPDIELVIKPTTGGKVFASAALRNLSVNGSAMHSNALIDWADVVMGTTSSILLEALLRDKPLLYPRHFHENGQLFDDMGACVAVDDLDCLMQALDDLKARRGELLYPRANVNAFLDEVIYGGKPERDVLGEYREAIVAAAEGKRLNVVTTPASGAPRRPELALQ